MAKIKRKLSKREESLIKKRIGLFLMVNGITSVDEQEALSLGLFLKPFMDDPDVTMLGMDVRVAKQSRRLYFNSQLDKITVVKTDCGWTYKGGATITHKDLVPVELACAIEQCYKTFVETYLAEGLPAGSDRGELSTEIIDILIQLQADAFKRDVLTKLLLGDTGNEDTYYNSLDGVYKKLATAAAGGHIADAGAITDDDLSLENIEATLYKIWNMQPRLLRSVPNAAKKWWVTGSVYDAWARFLQLKTGNQIVIQTDYIVNGVNNVSYQGVEMVPLRIVDARIGADFSPGSPATPENPHRIILTQPLNHALILDKSSFGDAKQWYSQDFDVFRAVGSALIAYEYKYDEFQVIAGFGV